MSSTASNVSATPAVASSPWPQTAAASQDNAQDHSGGPFAALLDAAAAAPDTTNPQPQPAAPRTSTAAANQLAAKIASRRNNGTAGAGHSAPSGGQAPAGATKNANATATPVASSNAAVDPSATPNATANQAGTAAPTDIAGAGTALDIFAGAATTIVTDAAANAATPDATTKTSPDTQDDSGDGTDAAPRGRGSCDQRPGPARSCGRHHQCGHRYTADSNRCGRAKHGDRRFGHSQCEIGAADRRR